MKRKKVIKVSLGTDIVMVSPSHPLSVVMQTKHVVDRILTLDDSEFEYECNSLEGLAVFQFYGQEQHPEELKVVYCLNGKKVKYDEAKADLERGRQYVEQIIEKTL